jgi:hypothetical protein
MAQAHPVQAFLATNLLPMAFTPSSLRLSRNSHHGQDALLVLPKEPCHCPSCTCQEIRVVKERRKEWLSSCTVGVAKGALLSELHF